MQDFEDSNKAWGFRLHLFIHANKSNLKIRLEVYVNSSNIWIQSTPSLKTFITHVETHWLTRPIVTCHYEVLGSQPEVAGLAEFPGLQLHAHNYRHNEPFREKAVLVVGASFSGGAYVPPASTQFLLCGLLKLA